MTAPGMLAAVLLLAGVLEARAFIPHEQLLGNTIKAYLKEVNIGQGYFASAPTVHDKHHLGEFDYNTTLHLKYTCDERGCRRKACSLARFDWCKDFERQTLVPWRPPPRGSQDCPTGVTGVPGNWGPDRKAPCSGVGVCNYDTGVCNCPAGWGGDNCGTPDLRPCTHRVREAHRDMHRRNITYSHTNPDGTDMDPYEDGWTASRCLGVCDAELGDCYCPSNTTFGRIPAPPGSPPGTPPIRYGRQMADSCKPKLTPKEGTHLGYGHVEPSKLFGPDGWCNADKPNSHLQHCGCLTDGTHDYFCDARHEPFCLNQCNGHGECVVGFCRCHPGWYGTDCSRKKAGAEMEPGDEVSTKPYLQNMIFNYPLPSITPPEAASGGGAGGAVSAGRRRPLIYVYDLPPAFHTRMLQYRIVGTTCTWRKNWNPNITASSEWIYSTETYLHEALMGSKHRTFDPEEADFFYIPVYATCYYWPVLGWADAPWFGPAPTVNNRAMQGAWMYLKAKRWVQENLPYWNRRGGKDHIFFVAMDEGACYLPTEVYTNATILTHWGRLDHNHESNTAWGYDNYTAGSNEWSEWMLAETGVRDWRTIIKGHPCFDPAKDLVIPSYKSPEAYRQSTLLGNAPFKRDILLFLRGDVGFWRAFHYSRGIRQKLVQLSNKNDWWVKHRIAVGESNNIQGPEYSQMLSRSKFCAVVPGDGWSARAEDAILHGCIPLVIQDNVMVVFEQLLEWDAFSLRIAERAVDEHLPALLEAVSDEQVERMQRRLALVMNRFVYAQGQVVQREMQQLRQRGSQDPEGVGRIKQQEQEAAALSGWSRNRPAGDTGSAGNATALGQQDASGAAAAFALRLRHLLDGSSGVDGGAYRARGWEWQDAGLRRLLMAQGVVPGGHSQLPSMPSLGQNGEEEEHNDEKDEEGSRMGRAGSSSSSMRSWRRLLGAARKLLDMEEGLSHADLDRMEQLVRTKPSATTADSRSKESDVGVRLRSLLQQFLGSGWNSEAWQRAGYHGHPFEPVRRFPVRQDAFNTIMAWLYHRIPFTR